MPKKISKKEEEETFFYNDPKENGGLDIVINDNDLSPDIMEFYKSLLPKNNDKKVVKETKEHKPMRKTGNIMKARSDLKKKGDKYTVDTEMNIKKGLDVKIKKALKRSIDIELDKKIKGNGVNDYYDSSSDEEDIITYGQLLKHLAKHITDPKEKIDPEDYKHIIMIVKRLNDIKGKGIRKIKLDYSSDEDIRGKGNCCSNNTVVPQSPRIVNTPFTRKKSISEDGEPPLKGVEKTIHRRRGRRFDVEVVDPYMDDDMLDVYTKGRAQNIGVLKAKSNTKKIGKIEKIDLEIKELLKQKNVLGENEFKKRMKILEDRKKLLE